MRVAASDERAFADVEQVIESINVILAPMVSLRPKGKQGWRETASEQR
jgi:hypothetical protein